MIYDNSPQAAGMSGNVMENTKKVIEFYGETCPYCAAVAPAVNRLEREDGVNVLRLEVWNNEENKARMEALRPLYEKHCDGNMVVPSFYEEATGRLICNPSSYGVLYAWVMNGGKNF